MSVCETAKMTYIRTMTVLSASIHSDKQACLFPQILCPIHFFSRCVLSDYEVFYIKRDISFFFKASDSLSSPALCVFVSCF